MENASPADRLGRERRPLVGFAAVVILSLLLLVAAGARTQSTSDSAAQGEEATEPASPEEPSEAPAENPPEPTSTPAPATTSTLGRAPAQGARWGLTLSAQPLWESNVRFASAPTIGDLGTRFRLELTRTVRPARLDLRMNASASGLLYQSETDLNHLTYGFDGSMAYRLSPRTSVRLSGVVFSDYARNIQALTDSGLLFEQVVVRSYFTSLELQRRFTPRLSGSVSCRFDVFTFGASRENAANGSTLIGRASLSRSLTSADSLWGAYEYRLERSLSQRGDSQTGLVGWTHKAGARLEVQLGAGASLSRPLAESGWVAALVAQGSVSARLGRQRLSLALSRDVGQAYGLGITRISNGATVSDELQMSKRLTASLTAGRTRSLAAETGQESFDTLTGRSTLRCILSRRVSATAGYALYRLSSAAGLAVTDHQATLALSWTEAWR